MTQTLAIELRDDVYEALRDAAERSGKTPDEVGADWLLAAVGRLAKDPLEEFIGAIDSGPLAWGDEHDKYMGQAVLAEMEGGVTRRSLPPPTGRRGSVRAAHPTSESSAWERLRGWTGWTGWIGRIGPMGRRRSQLSMVASVRLRCRARRCHKRAGRRVQAISDGRRR